MGFVRVPNYTGQFATDAPVTVAYAGLTSRSATVDRSSLLFRFLLLACFSVLVGCFWRLCSRSLAWSSPPRAFSPFPFRPSCAPPPSPLRSTKSPSNVAHAAASYDFVNFDVTGPVSIAITAAEPGFWDKGVDIEPWRLGIRPVRDGQTIRFKIAGPQKLSISRPGDFLNHATMLFVFAGEPPAPPPPASSFRACDSSRASITRASIPQSGDTYYLAPGSYFYGSLNLWKVSDVKVLGRGTIVYEGTQDPNSDEGWMQKAGLALHRRARSRTTSRSMDSPASSARAPGPSR